VFGVEVCGGFVKGQDGATSLEELG
jgi:hypothetical protein